MALNSVDNMRSAYDLKFTDSVINRALNFGYEQLLKNCYKKEIYNVQTQDTTFLLNRNIAKITEVANPEESSTNVVDAEDIYVVEITNTDYSVVDRNSNIQSVYPDHPRGSTVVVMDEPLPTSGKTLYWKYYILNKPWTDARETAMEIERTLAMIQIFSTVNKSNLQTGIGNWTLNGVSVDFNSIDINSYIKDVQAYVNTLIVGIKPISARSIQINKNYGSSAGYVIDTVGNYRRKL